ncbi:MAG: heavy metal-binding domain-containing protein [Patescibacteria group bacterium]
MDNHNTQEIIYTCPMHPKVIQKNPGMCLECGMALVPMKKNKNERHSSQKGENFNKHAGHSVNIFKAKFWVSFILSIPVVAYSDIAEKLFGYTVPQFFGSPYLHWFFPQLFSFMAVPFSLLRLIGNCEPNFPE